jgi:hypothetical protein
MTTEERFERIEHITAGIAEERRKDRDEYKALWRDTQRQLNEMGARLVQFSEQSQEADSRLAARIEQVADTVGRLAEEGRAADKRLDERITALISGFGGFIAKLDQRNQK